MINNFLEEHEAVCKSLFKTVMNNKQFLNFGKNKVIIVTALINGFEKGYHQNVLINNDTMFTEYFDQIKESKVIINYDEGYPVNVIPCFIIKVWNLDDVANREIQITKKAINIKNFKPMNKRNYSTINKDFIKPLKKVKILIGSDFATLDIETIEYKSNQIPIAISIINYGLKPKLFLINNSLNIEESVDKVWLDFLT